jgi:ABC-2 type transport system permease protein
LADLAARLPGVLQQLQLVAGLRWRILRNSLQRKNNRWDAVGMVFAWTSSTLLVLVLAGAFFAGGFSFTTKNRPVWFGALFWGLFVWWQFFPIFVAGFGANFEFKTLLRFPLSRRAFYLLGLGYGLADFAALSSLCWIASMILGTAAARLSAVPVLLAASVLFLILNVTLERLIGSWLEKLLSKRKSREIFLGVFVLSMVSLNFINPLMQNYDKVFRPRMLQFQQYISWLPASLAGNAVASTDAQGVLLGLGGLLLWITVSSGLLWNRFATQYSGEELSESDAPAIVKRKERRRETLTEQRGIIPPQISAVMVKEFRYLFRNGFGMINLFLPPIMVLIFSLQFAGPRSPLKEHAMEPQTFFPAIMAYLILILLSPAYNSFAFEGKGIQAYFMAPVQFRDVLLGKNLMLMVVVVAELAISLSIMIWRVGWPGIPLFTSTIAAAAFAVSGQLTVANWSSLSFPKRMELGKMKGQRNSGVSVWTAFGVQILVGVICAVVLLAGRWTRNPWLPVFAFAGLTAAALGGYAASLGALDRLAEEKKERLIETLCR